MIRIKLNRDMRRTCSRTFAVAICVGIMVLISLEEPLLLIRPVFADPATVLTPKWITSTALGGNSEGGLVIGDVTGDGQEDVVYAAGGQDGVYVLDGDDGSTIAIYNNPRLYTFCQPQLYDTDNDGILEILVPLYYVPGLAVVEYDGDSTLAEKWVSNVQGTLGSGSVMSKPVAGDINGDGWLEIYQASADVAPAGGYDGTVTMLDHLGNILHQTFSWRSCSGGLSLADADNDGVFELYMGDRQMGYKDGGYGKGVRSFWAENLTERWNRMDFLSSSQSPVLVDVNGDGILEVLAGMSSDVNILDSRNGERIRRWSNGNLSDHYGFTVYDIDSDGNLELLTSDGEHDNDTYVDVYDLVAGQMDAQLSLLGGDAKWSPLVADISPTHPGMEIIAAPNGTILDSAAWYGEILVYDSSYELIQNVSRARGDNRLGYDLVSTVQDIDKDGFLELVAVGYAGRVYAFDTPGPAPGYNPVLPGSKRVRSEVTYFGETRRGAAESSIMPWKQDYWIAPLIAPVSPGDNVLAVPVSTNRLSFKMREHQGEIVGYSVATFPNVGGGSWLSGADTYGWHTYTLSLARSLAYDTAYRWTITASDGVNRIVRTYSFRTEHAPIVGNYLPTQGTPSLVPQDGLGTTASTFECSNRSTADLNGDQVTNIYRWLVDGQPVANLLMPFDTRDETMTKDYSGYGNNGAMKGAVWTKNGIVGGAYSFDGEDDAIIVSDGGAGYFDDKSYTTNNPELGGDGTWQEITVEAWIYLTAYNNGSRIVAKVPSYELGFASGYTNRLIASVWPVMGQIESAANNASTDRIQTVSATVDIQLSTWYHIAFTYKNGTGLKLYFNGALVAENTGVNKGPIKRSLGEPLYIGRLVQPFQGSIDEVRIYRYAQPAEQIYNRYQESKDGLSSSSLFCPLGIAALGSTLGCQVIPTDSYEEGASASNSVVIAAPSVQYTLAVNIVGSGSVTKNPNQATYPANMVVTLTAQPASGWTFLGWSGDASGTGLTTTVAMTRNKVVTATFASNAVFSDGFESGNFNAWTGTGKTGKATVTVVTSPVRSGTYGARFTSSGKGKNDKAFAYKTIVSSSELHARGYFYVSQSGIAENDDSFCFIMFLTGGTGVAYAGWSRTGGVVKWTLTIGSGAGSVTAYSASSPSFNAWYSVELHWKRDSVNGLGELYVNGVLVASITNRNTASYVGVNTVRFGLAEMNKCETTTVFVDDCAISRAYIGSSSVTTPQVPEIPFPESHEKPQPGSEPISDESQLISEWIASLISRIREKRSMHP